MKNEEKRADHKTLQRSDLRILVLLFLGFGFLLFRQATVNIWPSGNQIESQTELGWNHAGLCAETSSLNCNREKEGMAVHLTPFFFKQIPVNSASKELLLTIKGVGPKMADSIIRARRELGPFQKSEDLLRIHGIGQKRMDYLAKHLTFEN